MHHHSLHNIPKDGEWHHFVTTVNTTFVRWDLKLSSWIVKEVDEDSKLPLIAQYLDKEIYAKK
jgi:hypothetical protein